jgi:L-lactate dehydrogenase
MDPAAFGGRDAFVRQTAWLARACRENAPRPGVERVRVPGENAMARRRAALAGGVEMYPGILDALKPFAEKFGVALPR